MCHCGAVVKELIAGADQPGSAPGDAVFCFFVPLFFVLFSLCFFNTIFPFGLFAVILTADPADHALGSMYILSLSPEFYFGKGISRVLDLLAKLTARNNHIKLSRPVPSPLSLPADVLWGSFGEMNV